MSLPPDAFPPEVMNKFRQEYIATFPEKLKHLEQLIKEIEETAPKEALLALRIHVHKIAGSSGTYGFAELSRLCKTFEGVILQKIEICTDDKGDPSWVAEFRPHVDRIKKELTDGGNR